MLLKVGIELLVDLSTTSQSNNWLIAQTIWAAVVAGKAELLTTSEAHH